MVANAHPATMQRPGYGLTCLDSAWPAIGLECQPENAEWVVQYAGTAFKKFLRETVSKYIW